MYDNYNFLRDNEKGTTFQNSTPRASLSNDILLKVTKVAEKYTCALWHRMYSFHCHNILGGGVLNMCLC